MVRDIWGYDLWFMSILKKIGLKTHDVIYALSLICGGQHVDADQVDSWHRHRQDPVRQVEVCPHLDQGVDSV